MLFRSLPPPSKPPNMLPPLLLPPLLLLLLTVVPGAGQAVLHAMQLELMQQQL